MSVTSAVDYCDNCNKFRDVRSVRFIAKKGGSVLRRLCNECRDQLLVGTRPVSRFQWLNDWK